MNLQKWISDVTKEAKKVRWPKADTLIPTILIVLSIATFAAFFLTIEDLAVAELLGQLREAFGNLRI
jgi:preprotein translocase SecE subunit